MAALIPGPSYDELMAIIRKHGDGVAIGQIEQELHPAPPRKVLG